MNDNSLSSKMECVYQATLSYARWLSIAGLIIFCFAIAFLRLFLYWRDTNTLLLPLIGHTGLLISIGTALAAISSIKTALVRSKVDENITIEELNSNIRFARICERISLVSLLVGAGAIALYTEYAFRMSS